MANTIKLKRGSGSDPGASDLVVGEIAIRTDTGKLFTKKDNGSVAEISGSGGGGGNNFKINTLSSSSGTGGGSATFNGTAYRFTLSDPPGTSCAQCLVSVNGVIQKPTTGTSQPSEGFAIDGSDILFSAAPASGADYFIITYDALSVTEVSDNSVEEGDLKISNAGSNGQFLQKQSGNTGGLTWASVSSYTHPNHSGEVTSSGDGATTIADNVVDEANLKVSNSPTNGYFLSAQSGNTGGLTWAAVDTSTLKHSGNTKAEATAWGTEFTGDLIVPDVISHLGDTDTRIRFSSADQFDIEIAGTRRLRANSSGIDVTGTVTATTFSGSGASLTSLPAGQLTGTVAAARLDTATTQSAGNNSTKIATTAYVETAVSNLVDSAPGALNTLNELAAALGDDANFSTTVTNSIATKLPLAGGTLTGDVTFQGATSGRDVLWDKSGNIFHFKDNAGAQFGDSTDLKIYHDGTNSNIINTGGDLYLQTGAAKGIYIRPNDGENGIVIHPDGAVDLYFDNSKKFQTTTNGIHCFGQLEMDGSNNIDLQDNGALLLGNSDDLQIFHNGSHSYIKDTGAGDLFICSDDLHIGNAANTEDMAVFKENGAVELYYDNSKKFETASWGTQIHGVLATTSHVDIAADNAILKVGASADLQMWHDGSNSFLTNDTGYLLINNLANNDSILRSVRDVFLQPAAGEQGVIARANGAVELYYDNSKKVQTYNGGVEVFGDCSLGDNRVLNIGTGSDLQIYHDGSNSYINDVGTGSLITKSNHYIAQAGAYSFMNTDNTETIIYGAENGAVELYHNGNKKLETYGNGVKMAERLWVAGGGHVYLDDASHLHIGSGDDLQMYHNGANSVIENLTGALVLKPEGLMRIQDRTSGEIRADFNDNSSVDLYYDGSKKLETSSTGISVTGQVNAGTMHLTDGNGIHIGNSNDLKIWHSGSHSYIQDVGTGNLAIGADDLHLMNAATTEYYIKCTTNASTELYYDGAVKFQTRTGGAYVYGNGGSTTFSAGQGMHASERCGLEVQGGLTGIKIASVYNDSSHPDYGLVFIQGPSTSSYNCWSISPDGPAKGNGLNFHYQAQSSNIHVGTNCKVFMTANGDWIPYHNNTSDLGTSSKRWNNLYVNDMHFSNEGKEGGNDVDGTTGDWTLQEGADTIFMINNKTGKKYKMALQEVS